MHLRAETPFDPFLDPASPSPAPHPAALTPGPNSAPDIYPARFQRGAGGLPREETFRTTTESLAGFTASGGDDSEYETDYGFTESDLHGLSGYRLTQLDLNAAAQGYDTQGDLQGAAQVYSQPDTHSASERFTNVDLNTPPVRRPIRVISEGDVLALPLPESRKVSTSTDKSTLQGTYRTETTLASSSNGNPFSEPPGVHFSSPATYITPLRALPNNYNHHNSASDSALSTPANLGTHPVFRKISGGYTAHTKSSSYSLNREVRLREAAKQNEILLNTERANDAIRIHIAAMPTLRPSPIALKVAAQLIRDSPAGRLPVGPQAVLHSKSFWSGLVITQTGLISMTAAITKIVHDGDIYQNGSQAGTASIFWLTISIVAVLGGMIVGGISFCRKMGYWINSQRMLGLDEVGLIDRLLRRDRTLAREPELGSMPGSVQTLNTNHSTPVSAPTSVVRGGLYRSQSQSRFTHTTFNTLNTEWAELYMTPEQLRERWSHNNLNSNASTPSKTGAMRIEHGPLSTGPSLADFNQVAAEPLKPAPSPHVKAPGTPNPFQRFPEPPTPHVLQGNSFKNVSSSESMVGLHNATQDSARVEVDNWSPLENLTRDINSEHVRNLPMEYRRSYITQQRLRSEERARKIKESLDKSSTFIRSGSGALSRRNSDGASTRPDTITETEEQRGRSRVPSNANELKLPKAQSGKILDQDGMEMVDFDFADAINSSAISTGRADLKIDSQRRRASGSSVEKMKKMIAASKSPFTELHGKNVSTAVKEKIAATKSPFTELNGHVGSVVKEKIERLREQSEKGQNRK